MSQLRNVQTTVYTFSMLVRLMIPLMADSQMKIHHFVKMKTDTSHQISRFSIESTYSYLKSKCLRLNTAGPF